MNGWYAAAADVVEPFNGKDLTGWKFRGNANKSKWVVGTAKLKEGKPAEVEVVPGGNEMINAARSLNVYTRGTKFRRLPDRTRSHGAGGLELGIYLMGNYEIQVLDSFGKKVADASDMGAVRQDRPKVNASKAPGVWQKFVIDFRAPKFDQDGKKIANAKVISACSTTRSSTRTWRSRVRTGGAMSQNRHRTVSVSRQPRAHRLPKHQDHTALIRPPGVEQRRPVGLDDTVDGRGRFARATARSEQCRPRGLFAPSGDQCSRRPPTTVLLVPSSSTL